MERTVQRSSRVAHGMGRRQDDYDAEPSDWIGLLDWTKVMSPLHGYGYAEGKCGVIIPLTAGLTRETMIAAFRDCGVKTCGLDPNHHAVGYPAEVTHSHMQVTLEEHGVYVLRSPPTPLHT